MRILLASAAMTAALVKGVVLGIAIGAAAATCARCASRGLCRDRREPAPQESRAKVDGQG